MKKKTLLLVLGLSSTMLLGSCNASKEHKGYRKKPQVIRVVMTI